MDLKLFILSNNQLRCSYFFDFWVEGPFPAWILVWIVPKTLKAIGWHMEGGGQASQENSEKFHYLFLCLCLALLWIPLWHLCCYK